MVLLPLLLPLSGPDPDYTLEETESLPDELQFQEPDKKTETDVAILCNILDTLYLLAVRSEEGRRKVKEGGTYLVIRELHLQVEDEGVREGCDRIVQVIMGDDPPGGDVGMRDGFDQAQARGGGEGKMVMEVEDDDEDDKIVEIF